MPFLNAYDIGNRALQHVGAAFINTFADNSKNAAQIGFAYDKVRKAELRRAVWRFATRRSVLRKITSGTTQLFSPPAWSNATTYASGQCVTYLGVVWQSQAAGNLANTPGVTNSSWAVYIGPSTIEPYAVATIYYAGDLVTSAGTIYSAVVNGLVNVAPGGVGWVSHGAASATLTLPGPIGYGPHSTDTPLSVYRLPFGYLRLAPQDRKAADVEVLGVTAGLRYSDWTFEDQYILTADAGPLFMRFVGDISLVPLMDDMFAEGFAARLGMEVCEPLTQSKEKFQIISAHYDRFMREARAVNAIEIASTEDGMDEDRLAARAAPAAANG